MNSRGPVYRGGGTVLGWQDQMRPCPGGLAYIYIYIYIYILVIPVPLSEGRFLLAAEPRDFGAHYGCYGVLLGGIEDVADGDRGAAGNGASASSTGWRAASSAMPTSPLQWSGMGDGRNCR